MIKSRLMLCLILVAAILAVYYQVVNFDFIYLDDNGYVFENSYVLGGLRLSGIRWALTATDMGNWHPVTWVSYMLDSQLFGTGPAGYHAVNLVVHVVNSVFLLVLLHRLTKCFWQSCFVAFLFALHPLHIESVAWVAERKDVLSCLFFLVTLYMYYGYVDKPKPYKYLMALATFAVGLMAKPMIVTVPFVLLLIDYWPLGRLRGFGALQVTRQRVAAIGSQPSASVFFDKIPFFMLSALSGVVTIYAQRRGGAVASLTLLPFLTRLENALVAYPSYILKTLYPAHLSVIYPFNAAIPAWEVVTASAFLVLATALVFRYRKQCPYLLFGWLWFLVTLLPVIGVIQVGTQKMADRYSYIPLIGLFIMGAWFVPELCKRWRYQRQFLVATAIVTVLGASLCTWYQLRFWKNTESLFTRALQVAPEGNFLAYQVLGSILVKTGRVAEGMSLLHTAVRINPTSPAVLISLANAYVKQGQYDKAVEQYEIALQLEPANPITNYFMGSALSQMGRLEDAIRFFQETIKFDPDYYEAYNNLGIVYARLGRIPEAVEQFTRAQQINPLSERINYNLGVMLVAEGRYTDADKYFAEALRIKPGFTEARRDFELNRRRIRGGVH